MTISVLILTYNEEVNLPKALSCLEWCEDVVVVDSGSTDATRAIAEEHGARFHEHPFENFADQRNWALREPEFRNRWVYSMDADEWLPDDLIAEMLSAVADAPEEVAAFRLRYKNFYMGRWLRHATLYPTWLTRLVRPDRVRFEPRLVNAHPIVEGEVGRLEGHFHHFSFNRGMEWWFEKHNRYSTAEAVETLKSWESRIPWGDLVSRDPVARRRALKILSMRVPGRPPLKFLYMYLWRRGFLDGYPGFSYCVLQSVYEAMIVAKVNEMRHRAKGESI